MSDLAAALRAHFGRDVPVERVIASEDVFKISIVLSSDRAIIVEDRLGSLVVKGDHLYTAITGVELKEGFLGKEVHLQTAAGPVRLQKLRPDDAAEIVRRFGGAASAAPAPEASAPDPVPPPARAFPPLQPLSTSPSPAPPSYPVPPPSAARKSAVKDPPYTHAEVAAKAAQAAAFIAVIGAIVGRLLPYGGYFVSMLHSVITWTVIAAFGAWPYHRAKMGALARYGVAAGVFVAVTQYLMTIIGLWQLISFAQMATAWAIVSVGYFAVRGSKTPLDRAAIVGAAFGALDAFLMPRFLAGFSGGEYYGGTFAFAIFLHTGLFWGLQYWLQRSPQSPLPE